MVRTIFCCAVIFLCSVSGKEEIKLYPGLENVFQSQMQRRASSEELPYLSESWRPAPPYPAMLSDEFDSNKPRKISKFDLALAESIAEMLKPAKIPKRTIENMDYDSMSIPDVPEQEEILQEQRKFKTKVRPYMRDASIGAASRPYSYQETMIKAHYGQPPLAIPLYKYTTYKNHIKEMGPAEFAYTPSDPRYYETAKTDTPESEETKDYDSSDNDQEDQIFVDTAGDFIKQKHIDYQNTELTTNPVKMVAIKSPFEDDTAAGMYIVAVVAGISAAATVALIAFGIGWYNLKKHIKNSSDVEYPAYGVTGPNKDISPSGDRRLAQSAQMYHYQHQKQQIIAMEKSAQEGRSSLSDVESDEENEEGDYTVYECPGLAPTGEMEVKNPIFQDDPTPAQKAENVQNK